MYHGTVRSSSQYQQNSSYNNIILYQYYIILFIAAVQPLCSFAPSLLKTSHTHTHDGTCPLRLFLPTLTGKRESKSRLKCVKRLESLVNGDLDHTLICKKCDSAIGRCTYISRLNIIVLYYVFMYLLLIFIRLSTTSTQLQLEVCIVRSIPAFDILPTCTVYSMQCRASSALVQGTAQLILKIQNSEVNKNTHTHKLSLTHSFKLQPKNKKTKTADHEFLCWIRRPMTYQTFNMQY